jgi:hypothetical protein
MWALVVKWELERLWFRSVLECLQTMGSLWELVMMVMEWKMKSMLVVRMAHPFHVGRCNCLCHRSSIPSLIMRL